MSLPASQQRNHTEEASGLATALPAAPSATVYDEYYAFIEPPFSLTPNTRFFFWGGSHAHVLEQVMVALRAREGVVVVTGATGTGKTMLCWVVAHHVRTNALLSMFVNPTLGPDDLLKQILEDFGAVPDHRPITETGYALFRMLEQFLVERIRHGDRAVILIDEAHQLRPEVIEQIRLLSNLESEHAKLLQIILIGLPELEAVLRRPEHQRFDERVSRRCELLPLPQAEIGRYIDRRLAIAQAFNADAAGDPSPVQAVLSGDASDTLQVQRVQFTADALAEIATRTQGIPRHINLLSDRALEVGHERQARAIDRVLVLSAASRLKLPKPRGWRRPDARVAAAAAAVMFVAAAAATAGWWLASGSRQTRAASPSEIPLTATAPPLGTTPTAVTAPAARRIETSPSVIVAAVSFETVERAEEVVGGLARLGLPAFARVAPASRWHQAVVGPYVSVDEARAAERRLPTLRITNPVILMVGRPERSTRAPSTSATADNPVGRVLILPVEDRASLLVEVRDPAVQASREPVSDTALVVDIGPVAAPVLSEERDAAPDTPLVSHVSIQEAAKPGKGTFIRLRITLRTPSRSQVRVAGRRVYLDFSPLVPSASPRRLPETVVETPADPAGSIDAVESTAPARPTASRPALPSGPVVAAQILHRASELAGKSDVRGLERLQAEVLQRTGALNPQNQQPGDFKRVLDELERYTRDARAQRLQQDARLFQRDASDRYRTAMRPILTRLERLRPAFIAAAKRPLSSGNATNQQLQSLAAAGDQLRAITVPPALAATHRRVQDALALVTDALLHPGDGAERKIAEAAALLDRAQADVTNPRSAERAPR